MVIPIPDPPLPKIIGATWELFGCTENPTSHCLLLSPSTTYNNTKLKTLFHHPVERIVTTRGKEQNKSTRRHPPSPSKPVSPSERPQRRPKPIIILCLFRPRKRSKPLRVEGGLVRHQQKKHHQQDGDAPRRTPGLAGRGVAVRPELPQGEPAAGKPRKHNEDEQNGQQEEEELDVDHGILELGLVVGVLREG